MVQFAQTLIDNRGNIQCMVPVSYTHLKIMTGLLQAEEGSVLINGKDALADPDQLKSCIGYVPD